MEKKPKSGFTTGTCAAAAAKAAAILLCSGKRMDQVYIVTPGGRETVIQIYNTEKKADSVRCAVIKDSGDDPDVTNQAVISAAVERIPQLRIKQQAGGWYGSEEYPGVYVTGGEGIGIVTKPGLSCPVGKHAINPVPRNMILEEVFRVKEEWGVTAQFLVTVEIPAGKELAEKTFNPRLGIEGGLSILGTTGIVEPMSEDALAATIRLDIHMKAAGGCRYLILTPGNYGETFLREQRGISLETAVKCSNFIAESVKIAAEEGFTRGLFAGHVGKLIKVAGGVENTHSKYGDRRMEVLWDCTKECLLSESMEAAEEEELRQKILSSNTTEEALSFLEERKIRQKAGAVIAEKIKKQIILWTGGRLSMDVIVFSSELGVLGETGGEE